MCLTKVEKVLKPIDWTERQGWKVFRRDPDSPSGYAFEFRRFHGKSDVPTNRWLKAHVQGIWKGYRSGFHVFATRAGAREWYEGEGEFAVVKVRARGVQTIGLQSGHKCLVAREMFVPRPKTRKSPKREAANA